jgi:hypothetical protein
MLIGSAILVDDIVYWLKFPNRHGDVANKMFDVSVAFIKDKVMGFVNDNHEFLNRQEAAEYAFTTGQISSKVTVLMSEDLF